MLKFKELTYRVVPDLNPTGSEEGNLYCAKKPIRYPAIYLRYVTKEVRMFDDEVQLTLRPKLSLSSMLGDLTLPDLKSEEMKQQQDADNQTKDSIDSLANEENSSRVRQSMKPRTGIDYQEFLYLLIIQNDAICDILSLIDTEYGDDFSTPVLRRNADHAIQVSELGQTSELALKFNLWLRKSVIITQGIDRSLNSVERNEQARQQLLELFKKHVQDMNQCWEAAQRNLQLLQIEQQMNAFEEAEEAFNLHLCAFLDKHKKLGFKTTAEYQRLLKNYYYQGEPEIGIQTFSEMKVTDCLGVSKVTRVQTSYIERNEQKSDTASAATASAMPQMTHENYDDWVLSNDLSNDLSNEKKAQQDEVNLYEQSLPKEKARKALSSLPADHFEAFCAKGHHNTLAYSLRANQDHLGVDFPAEVEISSPKIRKSQNQKNLKFWGSLFLAILGFVLLGTGILSIAGVIALSLSETVALGTFLGISGTFAFTGLLSSFSEINQSYQYAKRLEKLGVEPIRVNQEKYAFLKSWKFWVGIVLIVVGTALFATGLGVFASAGFFAAGGVMFGMSAIQLSASLAVVSGSSTLILASLTMSEQAFFDYDNETSDRELELVLQICGEQKGMKPPLQREQPSVFYEAGDFTALENPPNAQKTHVDPLCKEEGLIPTKVVTTQLNSNTYPTIESEPQSDKAKTETETKWSGISSSHRKVGRLLYDQKRRQINCNPIKKAKSTYLALKQKREAEFENKYTEKLQCHQKDLKGFDFENQDAVLLAEKLLKEKGGRKGSLGFERIGRILSLALREKVLEQSKYEEICKQLIEKILETKVRINELIYLYFGLNFNLTLGHLILERVSRELFKLDISPEDYQKLVDFDPVRTHGILQVDDKLIEVSGLIEVDQVTPVLNVVGELVHRYSLLYSECVSSLIRLITDEDEQGVSEVKEASEFEAAYNDQNDQRESPWPKTASTPSRNTLVAYYSLEPDFLEPDSLGSDSFEGIKNLACKVIR